MVSSCLQSPRYTETNNVYHSLSYLASSMDAFFMAKYTEESQLRIYKVAIRSNKPLILDRYYEGGMKIVMTIPL